MARHFYEPSDQLLYTETMPCAAAPTTFGCWYYPDTNVEPYIMGFLGTGNFHLLEHQSTGYFSANAYDGVQGKAVTTSTIVVGAWNHVCGAYESSTSRMAWLNGGSKGTNTTEITVPPSPYVFSISGEYPNLDTILWPVNGALAEAFVYNVVLSDFEVWLLAKLRFSPLLVRPQNLVFYAPLVNNEDYDIVGGIKMLAVNSPTTAAHPPGIIYPSPRTRVIPGPNMPPPILRAR